MARYGVAPTKTNLLRLKTEHSFVREGHQLLEQKKDILVTELLALMDRARNAQEQTDNVLLAAFESLQKAIVRMGREKVAETALGVTLQTRLDISTRRVMGVGLPTVNISISEPFPSYSPAETTFWADEVTHRFRDVFKALASLVETKASLVLLAREVKKTIRRVNALEKIAIPDLEESLRFVSDVLDEMERQSFFTMKLVKNYLMRRRVERAVP